MTYDHWKLATPPEYEDEPAAEYSDEDVIANYYSDIDEALSDASDVDGIAARRLVAELAKRGLKIVRFPPMPKPVEAGAKLASIFEDIVEIVRLAHDAEPPRHQAIVPDETLPF